METELTISERLSCGCWAEGWSKALVAEELGSKDAQSPDRTYTLRTLPSGVARGLPDGIRGDRTGYLRAGAIIGGCRVTAAGQLRGRVTNGTMRSAPRKAAS